MWEQFSVQRFPIAIGREKHRTKLGRFPPRHERARIDQHLSGQVRCWKFIPQSAAKCLQKLSRQRFPGIEQWWTALRIVYRSMYRRQTDSRFAAVQQNGVDELQLRGLPIFGFQIHRQPPNGLCFVKGSNPGTSDSTSEAASSVSSATRAQRKARRIEPGSVPSILKIGHGSSSTWPAVSSSMFKSSVITSCSPNARAINGIAGSLSGNRSSRSQ